MEFTKCKSIHGFKRHYAKYLLCMYNVRTIKCNNQKSHRCRDSSVQILNTSTNTPFLHLDHLLAVWFLAEYRRDTLINTHRVQSETDGQQRVHLVVLFLDLYITKQVHYFIFFSAALQHMYLTRERNIINIFYILINKLNNYVFHVILVFTF